uniref:CCD97-like C-terminal domain-containing protein n=1 Tax=Anthurium amnicola TaxID=1678845 RepID=A0A1D1Y883_9ARAE
MSTKENNSEVAVDKVTENNDKPSGDAKAEVKGTKRPAEDKTEDPKKHKKEENGDDEEEIEEDEDVEGEEEDEEDELQGEEDDLDEAEEEEEEEEETEEEKEEKKEGQEGVQGSEVDANGYSGVGAHNIAPSASEAPKVCEAISAAELQDQLEQFTHIMHQKFLAGEDFEYLDYSKIDNNERLDDHWLKEANQDAEEKYFAED